MIFCCCRESLWQLWSREEISSWQPWVFPFFNHLFFFSPILSSSWITRELFIVVWLTFASYLATDILTVTFKNILKFSNFDKIEHHTPLLSNSDPWVLFVKWLWSTYRTITKDLPEYIFPYYRYFVIFRQNWCFLQNAIIKETEQEINNYFFHHYNFEICINLFFTSVKIHFFSSDLSAVPSILQILKDFSKSSIKLPWEHFRIYKCVLGLAWDTVQNEDVLLHYTCIIPDSLCNYDFSFF